MGATYIPARDPDLDVWLLNFQTLISFEPNTYGLSFVEAAAIEAAYTEWHAAFVLASNPATRTMGTIATRNQKRSVVLEVVRTLAATIRANKTVSGELKIGLGLRIPDETPTSIPPPATYPLLSVSGMGAGEHDLRAADQQTPTRRARPDGAVGLLLFRTVGVGPASDPEEARFLSFVTRAEYQSRFTSADHGKTATYFARWTNSKGEVGPWGPAVSFPIAA